MNIIIVGDGKVGFTLAEQLTMEKHDVTVIDNDPQALTDTLESLDVMGVFGNGASMDVLLEAGVAHADLLIAATSTDEVNLLCCLTGKHLGAKRTIARLRNTDYHKQIGYLRELFRLNLAINPDRESAKEIARMIKFPPALHIELLAKGKVEMIEYLVEEDSPLVGKKLLQLATVSTANVLISGVQRQSEVYIPQGNFQFQSQDHIYITGSSREISQFLRSIDDDSFQIKNILIIGGGRIAFYLSRLLSDKSFQIKIIEKNRKRCEELAQTLPYVTIIHGDGTDMNLLEEEGIRETDAFLALTSTDEENLITAMLATQMEIPKIVVKVTRFDNLSLLEKMGVHSVVNPKLTTVHQIIEYIRSLPLSPKMEGVKSLHKTLHGLLEIIEFEATENTKHLHTPLSLLPLKENLLISAIVREGKVLIPHGNDIIQERDRVLLVTAHHHLLQFNDIFKE